MNSLNGLGFKPLVVKLNGNIDALVTDRANASALSSAIQKETGVRVPANTQSGGRVSFVLPDETVTSFMNASKTEKSLFSFNDSARTSNTKESTGSLFDTAKSEKDSDEADLLDSILIPSESSQVSSENNVTEITESGTSAESSVTPETAKTEATPAVQTPTGTVTTTSTTNAPATEAKPTEEEASKTTVTTTTTTTTTTTEKPKEAEKNNATADADKLKNERNQMLKNAFRELAGREPTEKELNEYRQKLESGTKLASLRSDIEKLFDKEDSGQVEVRINSLYENILGRKADKDGLEHYRGQVLGKNKSFSAIEKDMRQSDEAKKELGSDDEKRKNIIKETYLDSIGREPTEAEISDLLKNTDKSKPLDRQVKEKLEKK